MMINVCFFLTKMMMLMMMWWWWWCDVEPWCLSKTTTMRPTTLMCFVFCEGFIAFLLFEHAASWLRWDYWIHANMKLLLHLFITSRQQFPHSNKRHSAWMAWLRNGDKTSNDVFVGVAPGKPGVAVRDSLQLAKMQEHVHLRRCLPGLRMRCNSLRSEHAIHIA